MGRKRNNNPEYFLVVSPCMDWLKANNFSCSIVESKAVFSKGANRYLRGMTDKGFSDIAGCSPVGKAVFIETKAPGKRRELKPHQRDFLVEKIKRGAFAVCVDSVEKLTNYYIAWVSMTPIAGRDFLLDMLPSPKAPAVKVTTLV